MLNQFKSSPATLAAALLAAAAPLLLAYNLSPSPTFLNQALAIVLWGAFVACLALPAEGRGLPSAMRDTGSLLWGLALVGVAALGSWWFGHLPRSLALSGAGLIAAAMWMVVSGAAVRGRPDAAGSFALFCWGWVAAGALNSAIAFVQVFAPELPDGDWIAHSSMPGRAVGNIRQPNHLSSLLLWSMLAIVALLELRRMRRAWAGVAMLAVVLAVMLTASRTGLLSILLLALWAAADRSSSKTGRLLLVAAPLVYALGWLAMAEWAAAGAHAFGGTARLAETDVSSSRFAIWSNTLELIRRQPWLGVGFGEFNFAWTLTPFPNRPTAFFDHTHNLPLQLAVELGLPLALLVMLLLCLALWQAWRPAAGDDADAARCQRLAWMMVAMIGLHSLLEYPLWYAYFLLPAAWAWGFALGRPGLGRHTKSLWVGGVLMMAAGLGSVVDYARVVPIFEAPEGAASLSARVAEGQRSWFFSHHADYAAVTSGLEGIAQEPAFAGATHYLLDTRLMMAWARSLHQAGRDDEARHLAARLREFRNPLAEEFFDDCSQAPPPAAPPFQCQPPLAAHDWRRFAAP